MDNEELATARRLIWELHRLGGPDPMGFTDEQLVAHYRNLLSKEPPSPHRQGDGSMEAPDT